MSEKKTKVFSNEQELKNHLKNYHRQYPLSAYLKEIVYGGSDGIVTTLAVIAGFSGANFGGGLETSIATVLLFGFANLFADGASMGLSNYLSSRSEIIAYKKQKEKERKEIELEPENEKLETVYLLQKEGFNKKDAQQIAEIFSKYPDYWTEFMLDKELRVPNTQDDKPIIGSLITFFSFIIFGFIPILPYILVSAPKASFGLAILTSLMAMFFLGLVRWQVTSEKWFIAVFETLIVGLIAGSIAYLIGSLF